MDVLPVNFHAFDQVADAVALRQNAHVVHIFGYLRRNVFKVAYDKLQFRAGQRFIVDLADLMFQCLLSLTQTGHAGLELGQSLRRQRTRVS
jgi:hypothetical protein